MTAVNHRRWRAGNSHAPTEEDCYGDGEHGEWQPCQHKNHENTEDMTFAVSQCIGRIRTNTTWLQITKISC
jgi:hypothetical protein